MLRKLVSAAGSLLIKPASSEAVLSQMRASAYHTSAAMKQSKGKAPTTDDDIPEFQNDLSSGLKNLEQVGLAKKHWSWPQYNRIVYPPTEDNKPIKNPFVHHMRNFIKYPHRKLWYPAFLIRGKSIDEAIKQLSFHKLQGAKIIKETLLEAQELAVREHNIEFKSNLWISYSTSAPALKVKGVRKHRAMRIGEVEYKFSHYYVRLEEGKPPANWNNEMARSYEARAKAYLDNMRERSIYLSI